MAMITEIRGSGVERDAGWDEKQFIKFAMPSLMWMMKVTSLLSTTGNITNFRNNWYIHSLMPPVIFHMVVGGIKWLIIEMSLFCASKGEIFLMEIGELRENC